MVASANVIPPTLEKMQTNNGQSGLMFFEWNIGFGSLKNPGMLLCLIGLVIISSLMALRVKGSLLIGIIVTTIIGIPMGVTKIADGFSPISLPDFSNLAVGALNIRGALSMGIWTVVFTFTFVELFDTFGTLVGTANKAGLIDKDGNSPKIGKAMLVDAFGVSFGALMGTSTVTAYVESAAGIGEGGRTGLTAVTTGLLFLIALVLAPLATLILNAATAPALILVGVMMMTPIKNIDFDDYTESIPAFLTIVIMPLAFSISEGILFGILSYVFLKLLTGKYKDISIVTAVLAVLFLLKILI